MLSLKFRHSIIFIRFRFTSGDDIVVAPRGDISAGEDIARWLEEVSDLGIHLLTLTLTKKEQE